MTAAETNPEPQLNLAAVREHLGRYLGAPGQLQVCSTDDWRGLRVDTTPDGLQHALEWVRDADAMGADGIYHRGTTVKTDAPHRGRGKAEDSSSWLAVQLDVDYGKEGYAPDADTAATLVLSADVGAPPSAWVHSGHGIYPVWLLDAPIPDSHWVRGLVLDLHAAVQAQFETACYRIDAGVTDAARVWRIPGTVNRKHDEQPMPCVAAYSSGRRYPLAELRKAVPATSSVHLTPASMSSTVLDLGPGLEMARSRFFTLAEAQAYVHTKALVPLGATIPGTGVNNALNIAAVVVGHFVSGGFLTAAQATDLLLSACPAGWDEPEPVRRATIRSGLKEGMLEPYAYTPDVEMVAPPAGATAPSEEPHTDTPGHQTTTPAEGGSEATPWTAEVLAGSPLHVELERRRVRREADRIEAEQRRAARVPIAAGLLDCNDLDQLPDPEMILSQLIPAASVGILAGRFGTYKSFLTLSWACSLASGRSWLGDDEFAVRAPVKVLYIAAEGASGMKARARAWARQFGDIPRGQLIFYPRPVRFNDEIDMAELSELIGLHGFGFVVVDTLHRSAPGVEENSSTEVGMVLEVAARLRDAHGCTVLFNDHTGHAGDKPRGASAKQDDTDFVLIASRDGDDAGPDAPRMLKVLKLKDAEVGANWPLRLVTDGDGAYVDIGETAKPLELGSGASFGEQRWFEPGAVPLPDEVTALRGKGADAARDIFRVLLYVDGDDGLASAALQAQVAEGGRTYSDSVFWAGRAMLVKKGLCDLSGQRVNVALRFRSD